MKLYEKWQGIYRSKVFSLSLVSHDESKPTDLHPTLSCVTSWPVVIRQPTNPCAQISKPHVPSRSGRDRPRNPLPGRRRDKNRRKYRRPTAPERTGSACAVVAGRPSRPRGARSDSERASSSTHAAPWLRPADARLDDVTAQVGGGARRAPPDARGVILASASGPGADPPDVAWISPCPDMVRGAWRTPVPFFPLGVGGGASPDRLATRSAAAESFRLSRPRGTC
jgi:hypothetical protein